VAEEQPAMSAKVAAATVLCIDMRDPRVTRPNLLERAGVTNCRKLLDAVIRVRQLIFRSFSLARAARNW
jgi:hypothetical protein